MILAASRALFSYCYVQSESIQMGLLKSIKYSMFEVSVLKGIVDGWIEKMNISGIDLTRLCTALIGQTRPENRFRGLLWLIGNCGNHEDVMNTRMNFPQ